MRVEIRQFPRDSSALRDAVTGGEVLQLTNSSDVRSVHSYYDIPPWSPATGRIAFTRMKAPSDSEGQIWVMDHDGDNPTLVAASRAVSANGGAMPQWSADGYRVYYRDREADQSLIAFYDERTDEHGQYPGDLRMICPVGNRQAYHSRHTDLPEDEVPKRRRDQGVFVQDLETGNSDLIVSLDDCLQSHPRRDEIRNWHLYIKHTKWSPDGSRLLFVFTNEIAYERKYGETPRVKDVYVVSPDGTGLRRVGQFGNHPLWHPNGREVLTNSPYEGRPGNSLVLTDVHTGESRPGATCVPGTGHPSYSPDGRFIAADQVTEDTARIRLIDVEQDRAECLVQMAYHDHTHAGTHLHPVWSRDGKQLLYASDASRIAQLCVLSIESC